jgi:hypothetical protein
MGKEHIEAAHIEQVVWNQFLEDEIQELCLQTPY